MQPCKLYEQFVLRVKMTTAGVGRRFVDCSFNSYKPKTDDQAAAVALCREYADNLPCDKGLMIAGPVGTGKTHLAVSLCREAIAKGIQTRFAQVPELLAQIRLAIGRGDEDAKRIVERCSSVAFLVLDDLGAERVTDWVREQLFLVVNARYEAMLPTVVTTNDRVDELEAHIGQRIVSRLMETCQGIILDGADYRKQGVAK